MWSKRFVDYQAYLQSPQWQSVRQKRLRIDGFRCHICGAKERLEVHHRSYERLAAPGEIYDLITLCHDCHCMIHDIKLETPEFEEVSDDEIAALFPAIIDGKKESSTNDKATR